MGVPDAISAARTGGPLLRLSRKHHVGMLGLLALMGFGIFVLPVIVPSQADTTWATRLVALLVIVSGIVAIAEFRRLAVLLAITAAAIVTAWVVPATLNPAWHDALLLAAMLVLASALGIIVFSGRRTVFDRLLAAIALYSVIGMIWAMLYALVAALVPGAFTGALPHRASLFDWGYFSIVTLTTVGYGDITPVANVARSLAAVEAMIGQLYPAIIIARLVAPTAES